LQLKPERTRILLAKIYASEFASVDSQIDFISQRMLTGAEDLKRELQELLERGLIQEKGTKIRLSSSGRKMIVAVMCGGAFDIIHPGHLETLEQARSLGDVLIVSVARDSTFQRNKKRSPNHGEELRRGLVSSLRIVDCAILGSESDIFETVLLLKPDIIALGYDQFHEESKISEEIRKRGLTAKVIRLESSNPEIKTSGIIAAKPDVLSGI